MDNMPYVWMVVMIIMAVFEGMTSQLVSVWFVVGALAASIVSFFVPAFGVQFAVFVLVSLILLLITKPFVKKFKQVKPEATNAETEMFGTDRMITALNKKPDASPQELLSIVRESVDDFVKEAEQFDDLTMLSLEYFGPEQV